MDFDLPIATLFDNRQYFFFQLFNGWDTSGQTQTSQGRKFDLNHIKPTSRLRCVIEFKALRKRKGFRSRQMLIKRTDFVSIQIILHYPYFYGLWITSR